MYLLTFVMFILIIYPFDNTQAGRTSLLMAVMNGHCNCAQLLVLAGALLDMQDNVDTIDVYPVYQHVYRRDM
jgi:hypothetical protein